MDLLKTIEDNRKREEEELRKKQIKEELEQLYGYDSEAPEDEETLVKKFLSTLEKMRERRHQQSQRII